MLSSRSAIFTRRARVGASSVDRVGVGFAVAFRQYIDCLTNGGTESRLDLIEFVVRVFDDVVEDGDDLFCLGVHLVHHAQRMTKVRLARLIGLPGVCVRRETNRSLEIVQRMAVCAVHLAVGVGDAQISAYSAEIDLRT